LRESVQELLAVGFQRLVIDLRRITFIDLIGVKLLLDLTHDASDDGWQLSLIHGDGQPRRMLKLIGALDQPLPGTDHRDV
jgi:anti-anti-sigma regulatory factor